jgi:hypothetical protein
MKKKGVGKNKKIKVVTLCDWHVPFQDDRVVNLEIKFCEKEQPEIIILHELHDFYEVSRFDKNPERKMNIQDEIDQVNVYLRKLRSSCPKSRMILLMSNHLDRLRKYLWREAPELQCLRSLDLKVLLELDKNKIEFKDIFIYKKVLFKHGDIIRKFSSYTARGEFDKEGTSGCSGHTHRLGTYFVRLRGGFYVWVDSGCGCQLSADYIEGIANWQNGFSIFGFDRNSNHFYPTAVPIIDYRIDWGNLTFRG